MLFYGPPGTGKTSTVLAMARDLYGPELFRSRVMELNASDERGISVVREKVKTFAAGTVSNISGVPPFKLIILDEADSLTSDAQTALRRTMEAHARSTRFCIICNYVSRIIEPLASRCSKYRFKPLGAAAMQSRLRFVCDAERVDASDETLAAVLKISNGDMRKAITFLQSASQLYGGRIRPENVVEISGWLPDKDLERLLKSTEAEGGTFNGVRSAVQGLMAQGYSIGVTFDRLCDAVVHDKTLSGPQKALVCERIASAEKKLGDGADDELQLLDICLCLQRVHKGFEVSNDKERSIGFYV
jgi:replication factor C subunit 2/4